MTEPICSSAKATTLSTTGCLALALTALIAQSCSTSQSAGPSLFMAKRDACQFIAGQQYPYNWEGSNIGACIIKLPPQPITSMEPDPIGGLFMVPKTSFKTNMIRITSPIGNGTGEFNGNYIVGIITTSQGDVEFICGDTNITGSARGLCGLHQ